MPNKTNGFLPPVPALPISQGDFTFYVFSLTAKTLLSVSYTSERTRENRQGIQRGLNASRLREIGDYLQGRTAGPPLLPNAIIVSLSADAYFRDNYIHIPNRPSAEAFVLDGQHRLWSFDDEYSGSVDLPLVVSAFIDLPDEFKALVFRTINGTQRKINPSLVYDLIPMLRQTEWVEFEDRRAYYLVSSLNEDRDSPWHDKIGMVGGAGRIISLSSFMTALKKLLKRGHIFHTEDADFFEEALQLRVLMTYFKVLAAAYPREWNNKEFLLCKYVGVSAALNLFEDMIGDMGGVPLDVENREAILRHSIDRRSRPTPS
ncbi:MAG: DGQHR domain-containing protein [Candidatus Rokubacteria bacterium]|nr:DGQHR domain-containing protein [Candidatus Rokubacteria bacterium]